jgi:hypothetical protein
MKRFDNKLELCEIVSINLKNLIFSKLFQKSDESTHQKPLSSDTHAK